MLLEVDNDDLNVTITLQHWKQELVAPVLIQLDAIEREHNHGPTNHNLLADPEWLAKTGLIP